MNCWSCEVNQRMSKMVVEMLIKQQKESMHNWLNQPMNHRMGEPMNQRMSESMKQLTNESMNQWINDSMNQCTFSPSFSNSAPTPAVFWIWSAKSSSGCSLAQILPTSSSKGAPNIQNFEIQIELSLQSCALFVDNFPSSRPTTAETATLLWRPQESHYPKKHMVSRLGMFSPATTWWWDMMRDSHDDVVGMMVWMLTMTIVCNSEVF